MDEDIARLRRHALGGDLEAAKRFMTCARRFNDGEGFFYVLRAWRESRGDAWLSAQLLVLLEHARQQKDRAALLMLLTFWMEMGETLLFSYEGERCSLRGILESIGVNAVTLEQPIQLALTWNAKLARLFACDCAERTLGPFLSEYPDDGRPRQAIEVARRYERGEVSSEEREAANQTATEAAQLMGYSGSPWAAAWVAHRDEVLCAAVLSNAASSMADPEEERRWQGQRLLTYLLEGVDVDQ